jgi:hypothetical protein
MSRRSRLALAAALAASFAGPAQAADPDHVGHDHRLVRIGSTSLHPATLRIGAGDAFGWLNYGDQIAVVSFEAGVADKMLCRDKSNFRLTGDRIESGDVQARQFVALCSLAPGSYAYRVQMRAGLGSSGAGPGRTLEGTIVVE